MISSEMSMRKLLSLVLFHLLVAIIGRGQAQTPTKTRPFNNTISAVFVFGDSTVDPGNNNYIGTIFKSNFSPYGRDFANHIPTGRFTNGRLVTDFAASYVGVKEYVPPYLDPTLTIEELMTGVSFASANSGFDPLTPRLSIVISMERQLDYFKEYKGRLKQAIGEERTKNLIKNALFVISAGTNDFVINYFGAPIRRKSYNISSYQHFLMQQVQQFIQGLLEQDAQAIGMVGLPPMGCLPIVLALNSGDSSHRRGCIETLSAVATDYNGMLQSNLQATMQSSGAKIAYADIYEPLNEMIHDPEKFGFDEVAVGCCGTRLLGASLLCSPYSTACSDASKYVFWDSVHPTERTYYFLFQALRAVIDDFIET